MREQEVGSKKGSLLSASNSKFSDEISNEFKIIRAIYSILFLMQPELSLLSISFPLFFQRIISKVQ